MGKDIQYNQLDMFSSYEEPLGLQEKVKELEKECERLQVENSELKRQLSLKNTSSLPAQISSDLATIKKIKLFKSLFKGRTDVFPKRWESRNGKSGYSPACNNEWKPLLCGKPKTTCSQCNNRALTPLNDQVLYGHLSGKQTIGVYPLLLDDSCGFLAVDFDKSNWQDDVLAFLQTCDELNISASLERSRSGNGGHVWIFFSEFIPAVLVRQMGNVILAKTMDKRIEIGLDSYDRLFPNQDTMPNGGFGNLIALPLQKQPRQHDNSVFIDRNMQAYSAQWEYLYQYLSEDKERNNQIVSDVISNVRMGRSPLLLTERVSHLKILVEELSKKIENIIVLHGGMGNKQLNKVQEQLETINDNEERVILATGKYIGEGFDDPRLDTLFLAMPISWKGTLQQYAGRLHRFYDSKKEVRIYDYVDDQVEMLQRMYAKRKSGYRAMGYLISEMVSLNLICLDKLRKSTD